MSSECVWRLTAVSRFYAFGLKIFVGVADSPSVLWSCHRQKAGDVSFSANPELAGLAYHETILHCPRRPDPAPKSRSSMR